ncbi:MAG: hypothetical protein ACI39F_06060 [Acutalibacteraceae bacterium]
MDKPNANKDYILGIAIIVISGIGAVTITPFSCILFLAAIGIMIQKPLMMKQAKNYKCEVQQNSDGGWECPVCKHINLNIECCEKCKMTAILIKPQTSENDFYNIENYKTLL